MRTFSIFTPRSIGASLTVASDIACNPISHALVITDVGQLLNHLLIVVEIISEMLSVFLYQSDGSNFDE